MKFSLSLFAAFLLVGCATATADTTATPPASEAAETHHEVALYTWEQVAEAMASGAVLVDARGPQSYASGHIEGAINIPCSGPDESYAALPADRDAQLVFYCGGPACPASHKGAMTAARLGHKRLAEYKGGYPDWKTRQSTAPAAPAATE